MLGLVAKAVALTGVRKVTESCHLQWINARRSSLHVVDLLAKDEGKAGSSGEESIKYSVDILYLTYHFILWE